MKMVRSAKAGSLALRHPEGEWGGFPLPSRRLLLRVSNLSKVALNAGLR